MTNRLNEKRSNAVVVAAVISALCFALAGLTTGLVLAFQKRARTPVEEKVGVSHMLLVDAAAGLRGSASALTLCNEKETARQTANKAIVYCVRAETALECDGGDTHDNEGKEAFLNDVCAFLSGPEQNIMSRAEVFYELSTRFCNSVAGGSTFEYNGELAPSSDGEGSGGEPSERVKLRAKSMLDRLDIDGADYAGGSGEKCVFIIKRGEATGYASVDSRGIREFDIDHNGGPSDKNVAERVALSTAEACGYSGLNVFSTERTDGGTLVRLCHKIDGAMCRDECASVLVSDGKAVAFTAGDCLKKHTLPAVKISEEEARSHAPRGYADKGVLVTTFDGERDRVCYEYRYEKEDGVHYAYICAENGKEMAVR